MTTIGVWQVAGGRPSRLESSDINLESDLERWIEEDPALVENGLTIIGRQIHVEGRIVDLLAVDVQRRVVVIEVKRGVTSRDSIAQALEYAAVVSQMPAGQLRSSVSAYLEQRSRTVDLNLLPAEDENETSIGNVRAIVVGIGHHSSLEPVATYLGRFGVPFSAISYDVFTVDGNTQLLIRRITDAEPVVPLPRPNLHALLQQAFDTGVGEAVSVIHTAATQLQLKMRPYKYCIMYSPQADARRMLFTIWVTGSDGQFRTYVAPSTFAEFFGVTAEDVEGYIGHEGWQRMDLEGAQRFASGLAQLLAGCEAQDTST